MAEKISKNVIFLKNLREPRFRTLSLFLIMTVVITVWVFSVIPASFHWPMRVLITVAAGGALWELARVLRLASRVGPLRALGTAGIVVLLVSVVFLSGTFFWPMLNQVLGRAAAIPSSFASTGRIKELAAELRKRDIRLVALALPQYDDVFPASRDSRDLPAAVEAAGVRKALEKTGGVMTGDLGPLFARHAGDGASWDDDQFHLSATGVKNLAAPLADYLESIGVSPSDETGKTVLMGNCFAGELSAAIRKQRPEWKSLDELSARGDQGRVPDTLFLFPERYLKDTHTVVWLIPYGTLMKAKLPSLNATPDFSDVETRAITIRIDTSLGWDPAESKSRLATMPYPDGLVVITGKVTKDAAGFSKGETVAAIGYGMKNRELTSLGRLAKGKVIDVNLIPLPKYLAGDRKAATEFRLNGAGNDLEPMSEPSHWIHSWVLAQ